MPMLTEEKKKYQREYYERNKDRLRIQFNERYAIKVQPEREKKAAIKLSTHPLLIAKSHKPRKGVVKVCIACNEEFYCNPSRSYRVTCSKRCCDTIQSENLQIECVICGNKFKCVKSQVSSRNRKTCSRGCSSKLKTKIAEDKLKNYPEKLKNVDRSIRYSKRMADWRKSVFYRDDYTCKHCSARSSKGNPVFLEAHHVKQFSLYPELRFDIGNGITLCKGCHKKVHSKKRTSTSKHY